MGGEELRGGLFGGVGMMGTMRTASSMERWWDGRHHDGRKVIYGMTVKQKSYD
jgi:hypothetical protein